MSLKKRLPKLAGQFVMLLSFIYLGHAALKLELGSLEFSERFFFI